jgi:starch synthase
LAGVHSDRLRGNFNAGALNLTKAGIVYSNFVTTASPTYAWEAVRTDLDIYYYIRHK